MKNKLFLTESEKTHILGMHKEAISYEKKPINEATLKDIQGVLIQKGFLQAGQDDNKIGPITIAALQKALNPASAQGTGTQGTETQGTETQGASGTQPTVTSKFELKSGMIGKGNSEDEAKGKNLTVLSVTPLNCDLTEVAFKTNPTQYGYFKTSEGLTGPAAERKEVNFRRFGEGVKSNNPCTEFSTFGNFGTLTFS